MDRSEHVNGEVFYLKIPHLKKSKDKQQERKISHMQSLVNL